MKIYTYLLVFEKYQIRPGDLDIRGKYCRLYLTNFQTIDWGLDFSHLRSYYLSNSKLYPDDIEQNYL